jgi:hypothetical protein
LPANPGFTLLIAWKRDNDLRGLFWSSMTISQAFRVLLGNFAPGSSPGPVSQPQSME